VESHHTRKAPLIVLSMLTLLVLFLFFLHCSTYPVETNTNNVLEFESIWQYLKTYCIWQDSIPLPANPFTFSSPEKLLASTNDTLHGVLYTRYDDTIHNVLYYSMASIYDANATHAKISAVPAPNTTVFYDSITPKTALMEITEFVRDSTYNQFLHILPFLSRFANIMVDLRWNGGGEISALDSIISYFLPLGTPYIIATYRDYDKSTQTATTKYNEKWTVKNTHAVSLANKTIVILMNKGSASASEMMAAGLKDGRAAATGEQVKIVGETSYGKGIGQIVVNRQVFGKRDVKITFLRVKRNCGCADSIYHRKGIVPDIMVTNANDTIADTLQLSAAIRVLEPTVRIKWLAATLAKRGPNAGAEFSVIGNGDFEH